MKILPAHLMRKVSQICFLNLEGEREECVVNIFKQYNKHWVWKHIINIIQWEANSYVNRPCILPDLIPVL